MARLLKTFEYGRCPNSYDLLKAVALLAMIIDHIGAYIFPDQPWLRLIGRVAMPLFLFLVGYSQTYRFDGWLLAGALVVLASQALNGVPILPLNILFAILLWRMLLGWLQHRHPAVLNDTVVLWVAMGVFYLSSVFVVEYGTIGLMWAVLGWYVRQGRDDRVTRCAWLFTALFWVLMQYVNFRFSFELGMLLTMAGILMALVLMQFSIQPTPLPAPHEKPSPTPLEAVVIFTARNTLLLYVLHVVALQVAGHALHPDIYGEAFVFYRFR
jgi:hypothetical protein